MQLNPEQLWFLLKVLDIEPKCMYCGKEIKEGEKLSIFNKPTRVCCGSILCLSSLMEDEEPDDLKGDD